MKVWMWVLAMMVWAAGFTLTGGTIESADAALVTQLDFTSAAANWDGPQGRMLDRLLSQDGTLRMGQYQPSSDIVDSITKGHKTYSLFTSGMTGASAPSAVISGNSITVDLSSLFFGWQRGDEIRAWNIGGQATGLFNPQTSEFSLSWDHLFKNFNNNGKHDDNEQNERMRGRAGTFFIQGTALVGTPAAVPISPSAILYGTGLFGLGSWSWWGRRKQEPAAV